MNYSKLASKLRAKIGKFSGYVSENLDKTAQRFINEAIYGIMHSQSVMLTEIGRGLETHVSLKKKFLSKLMIRFSKITRRTSL